MPNEVGPTHDYEAFELLIGTGSDGSYSVRVIQSPAGDAPADACWLDPNDIFLQEVLIALQLKDANKKLLEEFGGYLFEELFTPTVEKLYRNSLAIVRN